MLIVYRGNNIMLFTYPEFKDPENAFTLNPWEPHVQQEDLYLEKLFSANYIRSKYKTQFAPVLKYLINDLYKELIASGSDPESNTKQIREITRLVETCIKVLYILAERKSVMYHNLGEMLRYSTEEAFSIDRASYVLDLGSEYELWEFDQMTFNNGEQDVKVKAIYDTSEQFNEAIKNARYPLPRLHAINANKFGFFKHSSRNLMQYLVTGGYESIFLKNKHTDEPAKINFLSTVNATKLTINHNLLKHMQHKLNVEKIQNNIDTNEANSWELMAIAENNWDNYIKETKEIVNILSEHSGFYLNHKYDTRGRVYAQGYHINYQGDSYCKAMLELANKKLISDTVTKVQKKLL